MVIGAHGVIMENAQKLVALVRRSEDVRVTAPQCQMVGNHVLVQAFKGHHAVLNNAQVLFDKK